MTNLEKIFMQQHFSAVSHFASLACFKYGRYQGGTPQVCENCQFAKISNGRAYCDHQKKMEWLDSEADKENEE